VRLSGLCIDDVPNLLVFNHALLVFNAASVEKAEGRNQEDICQMTLLASEHLYDIKLFNLNQIIS